MTKPQRIRWSALAGLIVVAIISFFFTPSAPGPIIVFEEIAITGNDITGGNASGNQATRHASYNREVYFNKPEELYYDETSEIVLAIENKMKDEKTLSILFKNLDGKIEEKTIKSGAYLSAKLSAPPTKLEIVPADERLRRIDQQGETKFAWFVEPVDIGNIPIRLDLFSQDSDAKDSPANPVEIFQETWKATAKGLGWPKYILHDYKWGFSAIGGLLAFFGVNKLLKKKDEGDEGGEEE